MTTTTSDVAVIVLGVRTETERERVIRARQRLGGDIRVLYSMSLLRERDWLLHTAASSALLVIEVPSCAHLDQLTRDMVLGAETVPPSMTVHRRESVPPHHTRLLRPSVFLVSNFTATPHLALLVPVSYRNVPDGLINAAVHLCPSLETTLTRGHIVRTVYMGVDADELESAAVAATMRRFHRVSSIARVRLVALSAAPPSANAAQRQARRYNEMYEAAVLDGQDFAVCLSDDTRCDTNNWDDLLIRLLCSADDKALGARSLMDRAEPTRFKHALVSRTHYDCFGTLFNEQHTRPEHWLRAVMSGHTLIVGRTRVTNRFHRRRERDATHPTQETTDAEIERLDALRFHQFQLRH